MRIEQIRQVLTVAEYKSINQAAKALYVSQPMLSQSIKALEAEVNKKLFTRTGSGVVLTDFGHRFAEQASNVVREYNLLESICRQDDLPVHRFRVSSYPLSASRSAYLKLLANYLGEYNDFGFSESLSPNVIRQVAYGESELGIDMTSVSEAHVFSPVLKSYGLSFEPIARCPLCILVGEGSHLLGKDKISCKELSAGTFVFFEGGWSDYETEFRQLGINEEIPYAVAKSTASCFDILRTVDSYCVLSVARAKEFITIAPDLKILGFTDADAGYTIGYIHNPKQQLSKIATEYIELLKEMLAEEYFS